MGTLFYRTFFGNQLQLGDPSMGATIATMMFLIILIGVMIYLFLFQRRMQTYECKQSELRSQRTLTPAALASSTLVRLR